MLEGADADWEPRAYIGAEGAGSDANEEGAEKRETRSYAIKVR